MGQDNKLTGAPWFWITVTVLLGLGLLVSMIGWYLHACNPPIPGIGPPWCGVVESRPPWVLMAPLVTAPVLLLLWYWRENHKRNETRQRDKQLEQRDEELRIATDGQVAERYTRAVQQLGDKSLAVRLGGIYALQRIARDSETDHWAVMETLAAFVRDRASRHHTAPPNHLDKLAGNWHAINPPIDTQAALTVVARRETKNDPPNARLDLSNTDLRGAKFLEPEGHLEGVNFWSSNLERAVFHKTNLCNARFYDTDLTQAIFEESNMSSARFDSKTVFEGTGFFSTQLGQAEFLGTNLHRAVLEKPHFEGTDLSTCEGLTLKIVQTAVYDDETKFPPEIEEALGRKKKPAGES